MFEIVEIFRNWCAQKINLATAVRQHKLFRQGEVWWCDIGMNVGDEIFGKNELSEIEQRTIQEKFIKFLNF